jgi:hypothetical protein
MNASSELALAVASSTLVAELLMLYVEEVSSFATRLLEEEEAASWSRGCMYLSS